MALFIPLFLVGSIAGSFAIDNAPKITPNESDVTVSVGGSYKFSCEADRPVTWKFEKFQNLCSDVKVTDKARLSTNKDVLYKSELELMKIDYSCVKYYYCVKEESVNEFEASVVLGSTERRLDVLVKTNQAARIYLFVYDLEHPIVDVGQNTNLTAGLFEEVIIPCKPTTKSRPVELYYLDSHAKIKIPMRNFNAYEGFQLKTVDKDSEREYFCLSEYDARRQIIVSYFVSVIPKTTHAKYQPKISLNPDDYLEGDDLELKCFVEHDVIRTMKFRWTLPNYEIAKYEKRTEISEASAEYQGKQKSISSGRLKIKDLKKAKDVGSYECHIEDDLFTKESVTFNDVSISEPFINITELFGNYAIVVTPNQKEVKWSIDVRSLPDYKRARARQRGYLSNAWYDNRGYLIPWSYTPDRGERISVMEDDDRTYSELVIRWPRKSDAGIYSFFVDNSKMQKRQQFQLLFKDSPEVKMNGTTVKPNEQAHLTCEVSHYPISEVTWSFIPHKNFLSSPPKKLLFSGDNVKETREILNQSSTLSFTPPQSGRVFCKAENSEGTAEVGVDVIVTDLNRNFDIWTDHELPIYAGKSFSLNCALPFPAYPATLNWFKGLDLIESSSDVKVITRDTPYSLRKELRWDSITEAASGEYSCKYHLHDESSLDQKIWKMQVLKQGSKPSSGHTNPKEKSKLNLPLDNDLQFLSGLLNEYAKMTAAQKRRFKSSIMELINDVDQIQAEPIFH